MESSTSGNIDKKEIHRLRLEFIEKMKPAASFIQESLNCDILSPMGDYLPGGAGVFRVRTKDPVDTAVSNLTQKALKEIFGEESVKVFAEPEGAQHQNTAFILSGAANQLVAKAQKFTT